MSTASKAKEILSRISGDTTKLGDLRAIAKEIKTDHELAMELWKSGKFLPRQLAILIMDKKLLTQEAIDKLDNDMAKQQPQERNQMIDWLMANQLSKDKKTIAMMNSWRDSDSSLQRRIFWYYQGRLRWTGQTPPPDSEVLLSFIEKNIENEKPEVQWAMNFTAAQIGIFQPQFRERCIALGERTGLFKDEKVSKNCTPNYLPIYISMQVEKLGK